MSKQESQISKKQEEEDKPSEFLIKAGCIDWSVTKSEYVLNEENYHSSSSDDLKKVNANHSAIGYKIGKYKGNTCDSNFKIPPYSNDILRSCFYKVSLDEQGKAIVNSTNNMVAAPCPPFCGNFKE